MESAQLVSLVFFAQGHIKLRVLFNAISILVEKNRSDTIWLKAGADNDVKTFSKGIS